MRIRSIKPEFWRSDDISRLALEDRLLFIGLWSYVDDNGVGRDRLAEVCADLFAHDLEHDPRDTFARVSRGLLHLSDAGLIYRYTVDGRDLLEIVTWSSHQRIDRPAKARLPHYDRDRDTLATDSRHPREDAATGTGEQGSRGAGEQGAGEQDSLSPDESDDAVLIPDDWRPNQTHVDKAASLHLDVKAEYQRFREHAVRKHRRLKNWNAGFTNWLRKQAEYRQERQGSPGPQTFAQQKQNNTLALVEQYREEEAREEVGDRDVARLQALA